MKKILLMLLTICEFLCHAQIITVNTMDEVFLYLNDADSKTLAIFDVDMVLIQPSNPAFQMAPMKRFSSISKAIFKEIPAEKHMLFLSLMTTSCHPLLIDDRTPLFLQSLVTKGIPTMALTANLTGTFGRIQSMEKWRVDGLKELGVDFTKAAPYSNALTFDELPTFRGRYSTYLDGVLFVNGNTVSKGDAFLAFLAKTGICPNKVIFVDDREDNLRSLEAAIQKLNRSIEYQGLHFLGAQNYPSAAITEEEFEREWRKLAEEVHELN